MIKPLERLSGVILLGIKGCAIVRERNRDSLGTDNVHLSAHVDTLEGESRTVASTEEIRPVLEFDGRDLVSAEHTCTLAELVVTSGSANGKLLGSCAIA